MNGYRMGEKVMNIIICDDEASARKQIKDNIEQYDKSKLPDLEIYEFVSGEDFIKAFGDNKKSDIIFLDIEMNKIDGIDTAKLIRIHDRRAIIIFISGHKERVFDTFDCETFNFITKPFSSEKFNQVFTKALNKWKLQNGFFVIAWKNESIKLPVDKIKFFESYRKHIIFHTYDGEYEMVATLADTLKKLAPYGFTQTHQGYVVNMNLIKRFDGLDIILVDGTKVAMSSRKRTEVLTEYAKHIARYKG